MNLLPYFLSNDYVFCCTSNIFSIRSRHRPIEIHMSITKNLLIVGWHIEPLKNKVNLFQIQIPNVCASFSVQWKFPYLWPAGMQRSRLVPGIRGMPVLTTYTASHSHGWRRPISFWLQRSGWGLQARCCLTGQVGLRSLPVPAPGEPGGLCPGARPQPAAPLPPSSTRIVRVFPTRITDAPESHPWPQLTEDNRTRRRHLALTHRGHTCQCYPVRRLHPNHNKVHSFHGLWLRSSFSRTTSFQIHFGSSQSQWQTPNDFSSRRVLAKLVTNRVNTLLRKATDIAYLSTTRNNLAGALCCHCWKMQTLRSSAAALPTGPARCRQHCAQHTGHTHTLGDLPRSLSAIFSIIRECHQFTLSDLLLTRFILKACHERTAT